MLHYATAMEQLTLTMLNLRTIVEVTHTARVCVRAGDVESRRRFEFVRGSKCAQRSPMTPPFSLLYAERVGALLDDALAGRWLPATWQTRIYSPCELPVRVERCVRALGPRGAWRAYTDSAQIFCAIARVGSLVSCGATTAALEVRFFDSDAEIYAGAVWAYDRNPGWCLHSILQLPGTMARGQYVECAGRLPPHRSSRRQPHSRSTAPASRVRPQERANGDPSGSSVGRSGGIRSSAVRVGCASSKRGQYVSPLGWSELQARSAKTRLMIN